MPEKSPTTRLVETVGIAVAAYLAIYPIAILVDALGLGSSVGPVLLVFLGLVAVFLVLSVAHYRREVSGRG